MVNHAIDDPLPAPGDPTRLALDIAAQCEAGVWLRFAPKLASAGLSGDIAPSPQLWADWLMQANPLHHGAAHHLLRAMSRHRWHVQAAPALPGARPEPLLRLEVLLTVRSRRWLVSLAAVPRLHVVRVQAYEAVA